jgi:octaprenyl-diphosphate synthase
MKLDEIYGPVAGDLVRVESALADMMCCAGSVAAEPLGRILGAGGKRLRPALVIFAARGCRYSGQKSIRLAAAMELIHTASLIHDDVIDEAEVRRNAPTVNAGWGNKGAVLLGDYLYTKVIDALTAEGDLHVLRAVAGAAASMARGEMIQTLRRKSLDVSESEYLGIISAKTASLLSCCCRVGAMLGVHQNGEVEALTEYGLNLGMAFQITDDLLDLTGEESRVGKDLGNDIREGRYTLPLIRAMDVADRGDCEWLKSVLSAGQTSPDVLRRLREVVERYRGVEYSRRKAREYADAGKARLDVLEESESRRALAMLADYVVGRAS